MAITAEHLAQLFDSDLPDPHLVVAGGQPRVVGGPAGEEDGLVVVSRADLLAQHAGRPPEREALDELAASLNTAITGIGG